ncbi:MAG: hypothetical protein AAF349_02130, partial [Cyanobacteria bacterium P01_A01_bin.68]
SAYMAYAHDLHHGQIDSLPLGENWQLSKRYIELAPYITDFSYSLANYSRFSRWSILVVGSKLRYKSEFFSE